MGKQLEEHALLLAAGEVRIPGRLSMSCKVATNGNTIGLRVTHPGITRDLIFYNIDELKEVKSVIDAFLKDKEK